MGEAEETTTAGDLNTSIEELESLAGGLSKAYGGVAIENSGTYGSEGKKGGGQPGASDIGSIDTMMIGKMVDMGAVVPTAELVGFMGDDPGAYGSGRMAGFMTGYQHGKAGKDMDMGDGKDESFADGYKKGYLAGHGSVPTAKSNDAGADPDPLAKSAYEALLEREGVQEAIDASQFLEELTRGVGDQIDGMRKSLHAADQDQARVNASLLKSNVAMAKALQTVVPVINELGKRLDIVERTPNPPRGATTVPGAKALAKALPGEAGAGAEGEKLSKAEVASVLTYMNLEKGQRSINGQSTAQLVAFAEAGDTIDDATLNHVREFLKDNPKEAAMAKSYH